MSDRPVSTVSPLPDERSMQELHTRTLRCSSISGSLMTVYSTHRVCLGSLQRKSIG